jgi:hypothetical protein
MTVTLHHLMSQGHNDPVQSAERRRSYNNCDPVSFIWVTINPMAPNIFATIALVLGLPKKWISM